jgi:protein-S-isoprenylcysteine O-methyltransferase Ste14
VQGTYLLFIIIWAVFWIYWIAAAIRTRSPAKRKQNGLSFRTCLILIAVLWVILIQLVAPDTMLETVIPQGIASTSAGLIIALAGMSFAFWARVHLGKNWSGSPAIKVDHTIVRTGPYRIVRHPIYTGMFLMITGTAIGVGFVWLICVIPLFLAIFGVKIRMEEKFMIDEFGEAYLEYRREVKALIPYVI